MHLARVPSGGRNDALNRSSFRMGSLVEPCGLSEDEIASHLVAACEANGLIEDDGLQAVEKTIASGLRAGRANPRRLPEPGK